MKYVLFNTNECQASVAILIKEKALNEARLRHYYIEPSKANPKAFIGVSLWYNKHNKCPATTAKEYLTELLDELKQLNIKTILIADSTYFKFLTKKSKIEPNYGYVLPCMFRGFENDFNIILVPNYKQAIYNPNIQEKITTCVNTLVSHLRGKYIDPGTGIIHHAEYPKTLKDIEAALNGLLKYPELTVDIEARGLEFWNCGIATIAFAWNKHEGVSFAVDRGKHSNDVKRLLKQFFIAYSVKGKLTGHNLSYDFKPIVFNLWMIGLDNYVGMIEGIKVMCECFDDTKLITYLATNNAVENVLKLKILSAEYTGNYAQEDIKDTDLIDLPDLLEYNLIDCLATWYVKQKYEPIMDRDDQRNVYNTILIPSVKTLLQTELCGMPIIPEKVQEAKTKLTKLVEGHKAVLASSWIIQEFHLQQQQELCKKETDKAKVKVFTIDDPKIQRFEFNPNSGTQLQKLIYDYLGYDVIDTTDTGLPATGGKTLKKLLNHSKDKEHIEIFKALIGLADAGKILDSFIPMFENAQKLPDGTYRLYGGFNIGGTKSGRLSSSPNLQNLPSHSVYAKLIKACFGFVGTKYLFSGADSASLEDRISALQTKDKNKLKVYTDGYCGHCLRAYFYYSKDMVGIDPNSVESINSIKYLYPKFRQAGKTKTFLLTYGGTHYGLMNNEGLCKEEAIHIETQYHSLYSESDEWVKAQLDQAKIDGYVTGAFGLRLRTPRLKKYGHSGEGRTAGNTLGQSYCQLNQRAANEMLDRIWASPYVYDIMPAAQIHDACYYVHPNKLKIVEWLNKNLVECMEWNELPEIQHDIVKLGAALDVFYPNWTHGIELPNNASKSEIKVICTEAMIKYNKDNK